MLRCPAGCSQPDLDFTCVPCMRDKYCDKQLNRMDGGEENGLVRSAGCEKE